MRALELLARWRRIAGAHLPLAGIGCAACSYGTNGVAVQDFELPILDYLHTRHGRDPDLRALFDAAGYVQGQHGQVGELLAEAARRPAPDENLGALLADLGRSIDSFARVHA